MHSALFLTRTRLAILLAASLFVFSACDDDGASRPQEADVNATDDADASSTEDATDPESDPAQDTDVGEEDGDPGDDTEVEDEGPDFTCDPIHEGACALPWPSSLYLSPDDDRDTGYTLRFADRSLPTTLNNRITDPAPYTRLDGYGLTVPLLMVWPSLDASTIAGEYEVERSVDPEAPILWWEVQTDGSLRRVTYWSELDVQESNPARRTLFVRPAEILRENTRYIVAVRELQSTDGERYSPSPAFQALIDGDLAAWPELVPRAERFEEVFTLIEDAGIQREELQLAWDFHTGSSDGLHGIMRGMLSDAFARVPASGPELDVQRVVRFRRSAEDPGDEDVDTNIAFRLEGTFEAPHYMQAWTVGQANGWRLNLDETGRRAIADGTRTVDWIAHIPWSAVDGAPMGIMTYGHGLLGNRWEILAGHIRRIANELDTIVVSADLIGMSSDDGGSAVSIVSNMSLFPMIADRLHQGLLEYLLLTRATLHQLASQEVLDNLDITIDTDRITYFGGSQGAIFGQTYMALGQDARRGFLAVGGNTYSTLLLRSTGFNQFMDVFRLTYPSTVERNILLAAVQLLWDNTEPASYVRRIRHDPFPGNEPNDVLMVLAKADYQVAVITNEHVARSGIEIPLLENYDRDRPNPFGAELVSYPHEGSGIILYDFGNPWPTNGNLPPDDGLGDPHSFHARIDALRDQMAAFLFDGTIINVCGPEPFCEFDVR